MEEPNQPVIKTAMTNKNSFNMNTNGRYIKKEGLSTEK